MAEPKSKRYLDAEDAVICARVNFLIKNPFFGTMATGLRLVLCDDDCNPWVKTTSTDGRNLYFNVDFVLTLTPDELSFCIGHEVLHLVFDHMSRRTGRDGALWDMATDYVVNATLVEDNIGTPPSVALLNSKYSASMSSEEVYEELRKNQVKIELPLDQHLGELGQLGDAQDKDGNKITITITGEDGPPLLTREEIEALQQDILSRTINAVHAAQQQGNPGSIPAGVRRMVNELTEAKIDWRDMFDGNVRSQFESDYTLSRLSRSDIGGGFIFPAQDNDFHVSVDVLIDASGSMTDEMQREVLSEVKGIMQSYSDFQLRICSFDTELYDYGKVFTQHNIDEIDEYRVRGGGGTDASVFWDKLKEEEYVPEQIVVFTDGYLGSVEHGGWGIPDYAKTMWVIHGNFRGTAPYGETYYYDDANIQR